MLGVAASMLLVCACGTQSSASLPALDGVLIRLDAPLEPELRVAGLAVAQRAGGASWLVTLYLRVLRGSSRRHSVWVHAYPQGSRQYLTLAPAATPAVEAEGAILTEAFVLERAGAYNLYAGLTGADGSLGPATPLGWIGAGQPETIEYHRAYRFLQEADDSRAAAMLLQTQRDYPNAKLP